MDPIAYLTRLPLGMLARCRIPDDLDEVTSVGREESLREARTTRAAIDRIWESVQALYRTGVHPAIQICVRRHGVPVLDRAIGHRVGNGPRDPRDAYKELVTPETPFLLYSASKAVTAMVVHKLDEQHKLHLEDRVSEYVPAFRRNGKRWITIRQVLSHRAGIPNLPPEAIDLDLLPDSDKVIEILAEAPRTGRPGDALAYHAVSGGFVLAEVVRSATGQSIQAALEREISKPLKLGMRYGVAPGDLARVARDEVTGPPVPPPISTMLKRALGVPIQRVVELARDPRFLTGVIPAANVVCTARDLCTFYECLRLEGELDGVRVFDPRTVHHATAEQSYREIDLTLFIPIRYGNGLMLGDRPLGIFGPNTPQAFGHLGFTNIFGWADPDRALSVALLTSGKPVASLHVIRLFQLLYHLNAFPFRMTGRRARR
jgi:CubicO group peptidase (beta-lactamase class C family)